MAGTKSPYPIRELRGVILCGRHLRNITICDVCDSSAMLLRVPWRKLVIDLCTSCVDRRKDPAFAEWSDKVIARNLGVAA